MEHLIAGATAGVVGTVLGFPLDTLKTRLQSQKLTQLGALSMAVKMLREEGLFKGFYRGIGAPLVSLTILNTMSFASYSYFKTLLGVTEVGPVRKADGSASFVFEPKVVLAGVAGGPVGSLVSTPFELVKTQLQVDNVSTKRYTSSLHAARTIARECGPRALYLGHGVNTTREVLFLGAYFGMYEHSKAFFVQSFPASIAVPVAGEKP
jgi:solute carrier family 25 carnitine/acylcarnitine transporter 20/29